MALVDEIRGDLEFLRNLRRNLHAHPELGFGEERTSDIVASILGDAGLEVHRGLGKTGVVGTLSAGHGARTIDLRADMDALAIPETAERPSPATPEKCMRPRWSYDTPNRDGSASGTDTALVRNRSLYLSAWRGGVWRREENGRRWPLPSLPLRGNLRAPQHAGASDGRNGSRRRRAVRIIGQLVCHLHGNRHTWRKASSRQGSDCRERHFSVHPGNHRRPCRGPAAQRSSLIFLLQRQETILLFFADRVPGAYVWLGNGPVVDGALHHNTANDFNDGSISTGVAFWVALVEQELAA